MRHCQAFAVELSSISAIVSIADMQYLLLTGLSPYLVDRIGLLQPACSCGYVDWQPVVSDRCICMFLLSL